MRQESNWNKQNMYIWRLNIEVEENENKEVCYLIQFCGVLIQQLPKSILLAGIWSNQGILSIASSLSQKGMFFRQIRKSRSKFF